MSIEVKGLTHIYSEGLPDESLALEDISFRAEDGQLVGLIGHTGSGKSTLVQHLNGLLKPKKGHIIVGDVDITAENVVMRDIRRKIGLVFQYPEYQLFEETVAKDVAFGPVSYTHLLLQFCVVVFHTCPFYRAIESYSDLPPWISSMTLLGRHTMLSPVREIECCWTQSCPWQSEKLIET